MSVLSKYRTTGTRRLSAAMAAMLLSILAACAAPGASSTRHRGQLDLTSAQWELVEWAAQTVPPAGAHPVLLRFDRTGAGDDYRLSGDGGCNRFSAPVVLRDADELTIATPVATRIACGAVAMDFEARLLDKLESVASYRIDGNQLRLTAADGRVLLFRARNKVGAGAAIKFIYVAPLQVACGPGASAPACFLVKEREEDLWQFWQGGIAGFDFESGIAYRLRILEEHMQAVHKAGSSASRDGETIRWTLDLIVEQETVAAR